MPRILGVDIPNDKLVEIALTYLYGVGPATAAKIVAEVGIKPGTRAKNLTEEELGQITSLLDKAFVVEGQLRRQVAPGIYIKTD